MLVGNTSKNSDVLLAGTSKNKQEESLSLPVSIRKLILR
jgi:hypothetical protein